MAFCVVCMFAAHCAVEQQEDDTAVIASKLGWVPSSNGNSLDNSTAMQLAGYSASTATRTASGIVTRAGVADYFRYYAAAGDASFTGKVGLCMLWRLQLLMCCAAALVCSAVTP
jgi:hypothetical protein